MRSVKCAVKTGLALMVFLPGLAISADESQATARLEAPGIATVHPALAGSAPENTASVAVALVNAASVPRVVKGMGSAISAGDLGKYRGGTNVTNVGNDIKMSGAVNDNSAINVMTGTNSVSGGAFANASGLPMVIQNSGNSVLIQNATIVNVQIK